MYIQILVLSVGTTVSQSESESLVNKVAWYSSLVLASNRVHESIDSSSETVSC